MYYFVTRGSPCRATPYPFKCVALLNVQILQFAQNTLEKSIETCSSQKKNITTPTHLLHKRHCAIGVIEGLFEHVLELAVMHIVTTVTSTSLVQSIATQARHQ